MSRLALLCVLLAVTLSVAAPARRTVNVNNNKPKDTKWWDNSKATLLTSKTFENTVGKDKFVLVQFCATFSKDCESSTPEYDKLALLYTGASTKRADVQIARIDGWTFNSLSQEYEVRKFPTYKLYVPKDKKRNIEYTGEQTADKIDEWLEATLKAEETKPAEEKKEEEVKKEEPKAEEPKKEEPKTEEPKKEENKQAEATNTEKQQEEKKATKTTTTGGDSEDLKKEFKLVLNTTLLQTQFDEVQNQLNKLKDALQQSITDNFQKVSDLEKSFTEHFKKVDSLQQNFDGQKAEITGFSDKLKQHGDKLGTLGNAITSIKDDVHKSVTNYAEGHFSNIKDTVNNIRNKVHEKVTEPTKESNLMGNMMFMLLGCAIGGVAVFFLGSGGNKKRSSYLD